MLETTIKQIEETLAGAENLSEAKRAELLKLLAELKTEVSGLSRTHRESALNIADKTRASTDQATGEDSGGPALESAVEDLKTAVDKFEASHPALVSTVNAFCNALADLGI